MARRIASALALAFVLSAGLGLPPAPASAAERRIDLAFFHERLAPYGRWQRHPRFGEVWIPTIVEVDWRPFTDGHWAFVDDLGWLWVSDSEWGWAPFHYGNWFLDDELGWIWIPGFEWSPAWVQWRIGDGFVGWCPLPPGAAVTEVSPFAWVFVERRFLLAPRLVERVILPARNVTLLSEAPTMVSLKREKGRILNPGLPMKEVERAVGHHVTHVRILDAESPADAHVRFPAKQQAVFRPSVAKPAEGAIEIQPSPERASQVRLQERHEAERRALQEVHERQRAGAAASDALRARHEAELRALDTQHERERRVLEGRLQREGVAQHRRGEKTPS